MAEHLGVESRRPLRAVWLGLLIGALSAWPLVARLGELAGWVYVACAGVVFFVFERACARLSERTAVVALGALGVGCVLALLYIYPLTNSGRYGPGSDRDEALFVAVERLLAGMPPYAATTYLGNPITPLPGGVLLALPVVWLFGSSAPLSLLALAAYVAVVWGRSRVQAALLAGASVTLLSAEGARDLVTGGDLLANALAVCAAVCWTQTSRGRARWAAYALLGLTLAWRPNFAVGVPALLLALARRTTVATAVRAGAICLVVAGLPTTLTYAWDPAGFSPLHVLHKLDVPVAGLTHTTPWLALIAVAYAVVAGIRGQERRALFHQGVAQLIWLVGIALLGALRIPGWMPWPAYGVVAVPFLVADHVLAARAKRTDGPAVASVDWPAPCLSKR